MFKSLLCALAACLCLQVAPALAEGEYNQYDELRALIDDLVKARVYQPGELDALFSHVSRQDKVLAAIARPAEGTKEWKDYRPMFLQPERVQQGVAFWNQNEEALNRAWKVYGVPPEMVVAIIGVETKYGTGKGRFRVVDTLATLAFDYPPRAPFFRKELREFLILCKEQGLDPLTTYGSYAGAMGYPQFMPSSWRNLAVDFNGDGRRNLIDDPVDAIGSVANYFKANGWKSGEPVVLRGRIVGQDYDSVITKDLKLTSTLGDLAQKGLVPAANGSYLATTPASAIRLQGANGAEFWLALNNFYVITTYNRSYLYAMAAYQLSQEIKTAHDTARLPSPPETSAASQSGR